MAGASGAPRNAVRRFDGRAADYALYRPRYPAAALRRLDLEIGFGPQKKVADVGSGTGILSELFLENGNTVFCVEPNREMRKMAESALRRYGRRFVSVAARAEKTGLHGGSVDLVSVGQALHWFDVGKTRAEFTRILKNGGHVSVFYNKRRKTGGVERAYASIVRKYERKKAEVRKADEELVREFFGNAGFCRFEVPNCQRLDLGGMLGRLSSASYMPRPGTPGWDAVVTKVEGIFRGHPSRPVKLHYDTVVYVGRLTA